MVKQTDVSLSRFLLVSALVGSLLLLFWFIFEAISDYRLITDHIEQHIQLTFNDSQHSDDVSDLFLENLLDKRLDSLKLLLTHLIQSAIVLFGLVTALIDNHLLSAAFSLILTTALIANLFLPILIEDLVVLFAIVLFVLSWLHFDLSTEAARVPPMHRHHV